MKKVTMLYGKTGMELSVPDTAVMLQGGEIPAIIDTDHAVADALENPIACKSLADIIAEKNPNTVAITVSDITRPVPNRQFLPAMLKVLNDNGISDSQIIIIVGTGMHRPSTPAEHEVIVGRDILDRVEVVDHNAHDSETLIRVSDDPPVSICARFAKADMKIVTGFIEGHFMAGFSGGRKGVCPALVDLQTVQRFHGYETLSSERADNGLLDGNPCHQIAMKVAKTVGVDFLFNVAIDHEKQMAGIFCGDLEQAHLAGCKQVAEWTTAKFDGTFDLVITNGGGYPLDQTFYQTVKGMCTALPAMGKNTTMLQVSACAEGVGGKDYTEMMLRWDNDWRGFLEYISSNSPHTELDQWEYHMHCRVSKRIGVGKMLFVSDGIPPEMQKKLTVTPVLGNKDVASRAQQKINEFIKEYPNAKIAVIPEGPYTMLKNGG